MCSILLDEFVQRTSDSRLWPWYTRYSLRLCKRRPKLHSLASASKVFSSKKRKPLSGIATPVFSAFQSSCRTMCVKSRKKDKGPTRGFILFLRQSFTSSEGQILERKKKNTLPYGSFWGMVMVHTNLLVTRTINKMCNIKMSSQSPWAGTQRTSNHDKFNERLGRLQGLVQFKLRERRTKDEFKCLVCLVRCLSVSVSMWVTH